MKKPMFKARVGWAREYGRSWDAWSGKDKSDTHRVRVSDAREITPEKAIAETILRTMYLEGVSGPIAKQFLPSGYEATVKNGKVTVRKAT